MWVVTDTLPIFSPIPTPWTQAFPLVRAGLLPDSQHSDIFIGSGMEGVSPWSEPSRWPSVVSSLAPSSGAVRHRRQGSIQPEDGNEGAFLNSFKTVDLSKKGFRFYSKHYFLTWSQIGEVPNQALEDKMASFGNDLK